VDKLVGIPSLLTKFALIYRRRMPWLYSDYLVVPDHQIKAASCTTVRTGGGDKLHSRHYVSNPINL
jgi:hypothetical protein